METTLEKPKVSAAPSARRGGLRASWLKRNGEANALAGYLFEKSVQRAAGSEATETPKPEARCTKPEYQKQLILEAAKQLGLKSWESQPITSRRELTPEQYGQVITALRAMIEVLGLPPMEEARDRRSRETQEPTTSDWKQFTKVYSDLLALPRHDDKWFHAWLMKFHRRHTTRGLSRSQLRAVIRGMEGIVKHTRADL